jgi:hypothetical protein
MVAVKDLRDAADLSKRSAAGKHAWLGDVEWLRLGAHGAREAVATVRRATVMMSAGMAIAIEEPS